MRVVRRRKHMRRLKLASLTAILLLTIWGLYAARYVVFRGPELSNLAPDDVVVVDYWTGGCGHSQHYMITFRSGSKNNARVELIRDAGTQIDFGGQSQTLISVQPTELSALDKYLHSRRIHFFDAGWSTEIRRMNISWFQDHTLRHHESFTDKMPHEYYEKQLGMTFEDLVRPILPSHIERFGMPTNQEMHRSSGGSSTLHKQSTPGTR